jgi:alkaline phosphatase
MRDPMDMMRQRRTWLALALAFTIAACAAVPNEAGRMTERPRNVIILFGDGAAATQWELGRYASRHLRKAPFAITDVVMRDGALGLMSTYSADAMVTDSAAAATAMSTGHKTDNDMISVTPEGRPLPTLMEAAKAQGKRIGLVTTTAVWDASPAAMSVHARSRHDAQAIVDQYLAMEPDVLLGGGRDYFRPLAAGGRRTDGKDVVAAFRSRGYAYASDAAQLASVRAVRLLGLFAGGDMAYEIDRHATREPSVAELAAAALRALGASSPGGFVLFVENENTDNAGHRNDIAALIPELWALDDAVKVALDFQRTHPDTLILVTGDHETGGLSITNALRSLTPPRAESDWFYATSRELDAIRRIDISLDRAAKTLGRSPTPEALDALLARHFPGYTLDADLRAAILDQRILERNFGFTTQSALSRMISRRTAIYWGTTGHTTQPAVVGALGPGASAFRGYMDNTEFAKRLRVLLGPQRETASPPGAAALYN